MKHPRPNLRYVDADDLVLFGKKRGKHPIATSQIEDAFSSPNPLFEIGPSLSMAKEIAIAIASLMMGAVERLKIVFLHLKDTSKFYNKKKGGAFEGLRIGDEKPPGNTRATWYRKNWLMNSPQEEELKQVF